MRVLERAIVLACQAVLWVTTVVIFAILCSNTVMRYTSGGSVQWASELPELLFPWMVMAGVVLAAAHGSHITTSFLMEKLPAGARRLVAFIVWLAVAGLYGTLARATWNMLDIVADEKSPILQVPGSVTYGCVMAGMVMLALLALLSAWRVLRGPDARPAHDATAHAVPGVHVA